MQTSSTSKRREATKTMKDSTRLCRVMPLLRHLKCHNKTASTRTKEGNQENQTKERYIQSNPHFWDSPNDMFPTKKAVVSFRRIDRPSLAGPVLRFVGCHRSCTISIHFPWRWIWTFLIQAACCGVLFLVRPCFPWSRRAVFDRPMNPVRHYTIAVRKTPHFFRIVFTWTPIPPKYALPQGLIHSTSCMFSSFRQNLSGAGTSFFLFFQLVLSICVSILGSLTGRLFCRQTLSLSPDRVQDLKGRCFFWTTTLSNVTGYAELSVQHGFDGSQVVRNSLFVVFCFFQV